MGAFLGLLSAWLWAESALSGGWGREGLSASRPLAGSWIKVMGVQTMAGCPHGLELPYTGLLEIPHACPQHTSFQCPSFPLVCAPSFPQRGSGAWMQSHECDHMNGVTELRADTHRYLLLSFRMMHHKMYFLWIWLVAPSPGYLCHYGHLCFLWAWSSFLGPGPLHPSCLMQPCDLPQGTAAAVAASSTASWC